MEKHLCKLSTIRYKCKRLTEPCVGLALRGVGLVESLLQLSFEQLLSCSTLVAFGFLSDVTSPTFVSAEFSNVLGVARCPIAGEHRLVVGLAREEVLEDVVHIRPYI